MRKIKFRGKTKEGRWAYGDLVHDCNENPFINIEGYADCGMGVHYRHLVKPDTIGQFTGTCDRNGKEIYEGDIMLIKNEKAIITYFANGFYRKSIDSDSIDSSLSFCEVIGNIHDNPELIDNKEAVL